MLAVIGFRLVSAQAQSPTDFYRETDSGAVTRNLVTDYGASGSDWKDDSDVLQRAIDELTSLEGGGRLVIPKGDYHLSRVALKSNVHLAIDKDAVIHPPSNGGFVITIGFDSDVVKNVSIRGVGGKFTFDFRKIAPDISTTAINLQNVDNFCIGNVRTLDNSTVHSSIRFNVAEYEGGQFFARNGLVENADNTSAHVGYGTVQVGAGRNILFRNITGSGGVPLRLESGSGGLRGLEGSVFDIVGRNISGSNGNAAVMISPHAMKNGRVDIEGVKAVSCIHGVRIDIGDTRNGDEPGYYADTSSVRNVHVVYGTTAQLKYGHFQWVPLVLRDQISTQVNPDGDSYSGPSAAPIKNTAVGEGPGTFHVELEGITHEGFEHQPKTVQTFEDSIKGAGLKKWKMATREESKP